MMMMISCLYEVQRVADGGSWSWVSWSTWLELVDLV